MRRSSSMENAISILPEERRPPVYIFSSAEDEDGPPAPLPVTPEPCLRKESSSTSSSYLFSPVSEISRTFHFLSDHSPGIRLVSSSSDLDRSDNDADDEEECTSSQMATVDIRTDGLPSVSSSRPFFNSGSLESIDGNESAGRSSGDLPVSRASQPSLHFNYDDEDEAPLSESQRCKSLDDLSKPTKNDNDSSYHSLDRKRGSNSSNNNNIEKDEFAVLGHAEFDLEENSDESSDSTPAEGDLEGEETRQQEQEVSALLDSPSVASSAARLLDLPSISEENEESTRSRHPSMHGPDPAAMLDFCVPEPTHIAPGSFHELPKDFEEMAPNSSVLHRRVVSDNHVSYGAQLDEDFTPSLEQLPYPVLMRGELGRASQTGRCMSQCILTTSETTPGPTTSERSLSKSDPSLEEKNDSINTLGADHTDSVDDEAPLIQASAPPPVLLQRKNSVKPNSWMGYFNHGAATPHTVVTPATAGLVQSSARPQLPRNTTDTSKKGGVEKQSKSKSGADSFSFISIFGRNPGKKRPKLDAVNYSNGTASDPTTPSGSSTMPAVRSSSRPTLPSFSDGEGLPDLPDRLRNILSPTGTVDEDDSSSGKVDFIQQMLENPRYSRFDLFTKPVYGSWRDKFRHDHMNSKAVSKQDAIFELIHLERTHCANLVFLQEGYRRRLIEENVLSRDEVNGLIPDVIEALLIFHLHLLERLLARQAEKNEIDTISDILGEELSEHGMHTHKCVQAYTTFGSHKDRCERHWTAYKEKNQKFQEFLKKASTHPLYRSFDFKTVMTRTISRPAKYGLLIETILKNESNKFCQQYGVTEKAGEAAKRFAMRIDNNLLLQQMNKRWDDIKRNFDGSSTTRLYIAEKSVQEGFISVEWNLDSICYEMNQEHGRRAFCIGEAHVKSHSLNKMIPVTVICFDDILVFLSRKNGKYQFAPMDQPVLSLHSLILRKLAGHSLNMMLIPPVKPSLVDIEFLTKNDLAKWEKTLEKAIPSAPAKVRLNRRGSEEYLRKATEEHEKQDKKQKEEQENWLKELVDLFDVHRAEELAMFSTYVGKRNDLATVLQNKLDLMPLKGRPDLVERVKESVRSKFKELRQMKTVPMKKLVDDMTQAKETILWSYLQELEDGTAVRCDGDSDGGSGSDSSGSGKGKPRRIKTFHGGEASTKAPKSGGIRRHTTVPRMGQKEEEVMEESDEREREQVETRTHSLPLTQSLSCHRECRRLIRDLEKLKSENISLKSELALDKLRITSLEKMRTGSSAVLSSSVEALEHLRKKEKDVREDESRRKKKLEEIENDIVRQRQKLDEERAKFDAERQRLDAEHIRREAELDEKWAALTEARNGDTPTEKKTSRTRFNADSTPKSPTRGLPPRGTRPAIKLQRRSNEIQLCKPTTARNDA